MASRRQEFDLAHAAVDWWYEHGRKDLPWQQNPTPYRVWVSEIMLQQTQVRTVLGYFDAFMNDFPTVRALAEASEDAVLRRWTGLGYYARARNLHKAAKQICDRFNGDLPAEQHELESLPGIGRSTAGAIRSLAHQQRAAILDGNVKRVLARFYAVPGWPGERQTLEALWAHAERHTPERDHRIYSQAMMDLGATLCTRSKPQCLLCPLQSPCKGQSSPERYPGKKPRKPLPVKQATLLIAIDDDGHTLLEKRPSKGIWGGLWSFPEFEDHSALCNWLARNYYPPTRDLEALPAFRHTFSHFHLDITPVRADVSRSHSSAGLIMDGDRYLWYKHSTEDDESAGTRTATAHAAAPGGFAAPVARLLNQLYEDTVT
ncbi:MAG: A/G-specific adenine glycosylase [Pseudomonadota bacterium]